MWSTRSWFPMILRNIIKTPVTFSSQHLQLTRDKQQTSTVPKPKASSIPFIEQHIRTQDIPESAKEIILASWRITTKNRYNTKYRKWQEFCSERNINSIQPTVNGVISFFSLLYHRGKVVGPFVMPEVL